MFTELSEIEIFTIILEQIFTIILEQIKALVLVFGFSTWGRNVVIYSIDKFIKYIYTILHNRTI